MHVMLLALVLALPTPLPAFEPAPSPADLDDDADSDPAAYMMVLEHQDGWQCAASLISIRTGVTTAQCARARGVLWALAATLFSEKPPVPISAAARRVSRVALAGDGRDPTDPAINIAVVELETPFGIEAKSRPILMATTGEGCRGASECHAIRALPPLSEAGPRRARFRVVTLEQGGEERCAALVLHWPASRSHLLCFIGDELCERDLGGGVVCGGRLCGALSAVGGARCSGTLAAQSIASWRRFLHCAHTLRLCGRGACGEQCSEHRLLEAAEEESNAAAAPTLAAKPSTELIKRGSTTAVSSYGIGDGVEEEGVARPFRPSIEFEPNRADFKVTPSPTSRVALKAGEYGDNAADYSAEETPAPPPPFSISSALPTRTATGGTLPPPPHAPALQAVARTSSSSVNAIVSPKSSVYLIYCYYLLSFFYV